MFLSDDRWELLRAKKWLYFKQVREREEETSSLMLSLEAAEGRARKIVQDKEAQLR